MVTGLTATNILVRVMSSIRSKCMLFLKAIFLKSFGPRLVRFSRCVKTIWSDRPDSYRIHFLFKKKRRAMVSNFLRSEEHTYELQSLMRIPYAVFCLKQNKYYKFHHT